MNEMNGWDEYRRLVLADLERISGQIVMLSAKIDLMDDARTKEISDIRVEIGMLKTRVVLFGVGASIAMTFVLNLLATYLKPIH